MLSFVLCLYFLAYFKQQCVAETSPILDSMMLWLTDYDRQALAMMNAP